MHILEVGTLYDVTLENDPEEKETTSLSDLSDTFSIELSARAVSRSVGVGEAGNQSHY